MKYRIAALLAVAVSAAMIWASAASANTAIGSLVWNNAKGCAYCNVYVHNNTTGANGSTLTNSVADFSFGGTVPGQSYSFWGRGFCSTQYYFSQTVTQTDPFGYDPWGVTILRIPVNC